MIEYELSLLYEVLHTKVVVARRGIGCIFRFLSFCFMVTAALLFYSVEKKHDSKLDIGLTYGLLGGSIVLDIVSIFQLISSDWFLSILKERWTRRYLPSIIVKRRRWSGSVYHYNIISYCLDEHPKWLYKLVAYFRVVGILDKIKILLFSSIEKDTEALKMLMFSCFNFRAFMEGEGVFNTEREIDELLGDLSLQVFNLNKLQWNFSALKEFNAKTFLTYHLASEVFFYHKVKSCEPEDDDNRETEQLSDRAVIISLRILSNYLFYILLMKPAMLSTVISDWGVIFQDTCAEAKIFFEKNEILHFSEACEKIRSVTTSEFQTSYTVDGNSLSKSVFSDACKLANDLLSRGQALLDLLCIWMQYFAIAAINCEPAIHAQQLSTGGELLTLAWLLLNHFGFGTQLSEQIQQPAEGTERLIEALD